MPKPSKIVACVDCQGMFPRKRLNRKFRCPDCAMKKVGDVVAQMHARSGPQYEHWKEQIKAAIGRL